MNKEGLIRVLNAELKQQVYYSKGSLTVGIYRLAQRMYILKLVSK